MYYFYNLFIYINKVVIVLFTVDAAVKCNNQYLKKKLINMWNYNPAHLLFLICANLNITLMTVGNNLYAKHLSSNNLMSV